MSRESEKPLPQLDRNDARRVSSLSFVVPCFNEVETIAEFYKRAAATSADLPNVKFEFIFVNDGSNDGTTEKLNQLAHDDIRVKVLHLARNCGHQIAITAGIDFAGGDAVVTIDADLQDPPELVFEMVNRIEKGFDIVHAQRSRRKGETRFKLVTAAIFYRLMKWFATRELVQDSGDFRAISRPAIEAARCFREPHRFVRGIFCTLGFRQSIIQYERDPRFAGSTKYPLLKMVKLAINAIISFSTAPLRIITVGALLMWAVSLIYIGIALYRHFVLNTTVTGWMSLAILSTFSTGLILFCLNILGAYVGRIYEQGLQRPLYWLSDIRNVDITSTPLHIANATESQLSLSILRSQTKLGLDSSVIPSTRSQESNCEGDDEEN